MKIVIAPDKFRDALEAADVAAALAAGVRAAVPEAEPDGCPLGDGGEGTGDVLAGACGAQPQAAHVLDPLARPREARWWRLPDGRTAVVEMAEASGLALLTAGERNALRTTTFGTGQLLRAASDAGYTDVLLCVGGSATVDGGAGCLQALGWQLVDGTGKVLTEPACGGVLSRITELRPPEQPSALTVRVLCDVDNPLLGPRGAAPVFGPQKGADSQAVRELERGLTRWSELLARTHGREVATRPGAGAAGGLPAGLMAALGATACSGFDEVADRVGLAKRLAACDLCLTGEGRIDDQTGYGKVVAGVARLAAAQRVPTIAFAGAACRTAGQSIESLARTLGLARIVIITSPGTPLPDALAGTALNLQRAARQTMAAWLEASGAGGRP